MTITKNFKLYLTVNWKTGSTRVYKKPIKNAGPFDIPIEFDLKVNIPEFKMIRAKGEIDVSETKVKEMTSHAV